jgi:hypothetical protein
LERADTRTGSRSPPQQAPPVHDGGRRADVALKAAEIVVIGVAGQKGPAASTISTEES